MPDHCEPPSSSQRTRLLAALVTAGGVLAGACDVAVGAAGTVRDSAGTPVADALVTLRINDQKEVRTHTDHEGRYNLGIVTGLVFRTQRRIAVSKLGFRLHTADLADTGSVVHHEVVLVAER